MLSRMRMEKLVLQGEGRTMGPRARERSLVERGPSAVGAE